MVTILPPKKSPFQLLGDAMSQFGQHAPQLLEERYQTQRGLEAIDQLQKDLAASGGDMTKILPAVAKAVSLNPSLQKSGYVEHALNMARNLQSQNIQRPGEEEGPIQAPQRGNLPAFMQQPGQEQAPAQNKFFPSNLPGGEGPGHLAQTATSGKVVPLLTPSQKVDEIKRLHADAIKNNVPMSWDQARAEVNASEADKKAHNAEVEAENKAQAQSQREYGKRGVNHLKSVFSDSTPEMDAIFEKKAEEYAATEEGKSEANFDRHMATEAKNFKNTYSNIQKDLSAPRIQNQMERAFNGSEKDFEQAANDLRVKLKPLLDLGLYDTSRKLLTDLGYYPEEREQIINPMSQRLKTLMNKVPKTQKTLQGKPVVLANIPQANPSYNPQDLQNIKNGLRDLKEADPNFSLVLARKAFQDKGYDWRVFKDALNSLQLEEGFKLESDQQNQQSVLDTPPLNTLQKILQGLNIIGR